MPFEFATAGRVIFGIGVARQAASLAREFGARALLVSGRSAPGRHLLESELSRCGISSIAFQVSCEPTTDLVSCGLQLARAEKCAVIIALGGGSVIDGAKAIAALLTNEGELFDYLEVIGRGQPLVRPSAPWIAIPTTAGAGAEVTRNAVLVSPAHRVKASLRSPSMLPKVALVDPELTYTLPPALTASTGLDALTQLIEPYVSSRANPLTDGFCVEGIPRVARSLEPAFEHSDKRAREDMCLAALLGGLALANAGLGAVHGFAAPIGGMFPAPHGAVCAALLPHVVEINLRALKERQPDGAALRRYDEIARLLTGTSHATAEAAVDWIRGLIERLKIPSLRTYGLKSEDFPNLVENAAKASSMKANPISLTPAELHEILNRAL